MHFVADLDAGTATKLRRAVEAARPKGIQS